MNQKIATYLGFAQKARKVVGGDSAAKVAILKGDGKLLLIATDAADRTAGEFKRLADEFAMPVVITGTKSEFGLAIGLSPRSILVVKDQGFAQAILKVHHEQRDLT